MFKLYLELECLPAYLYLYQYQYIPVYSTSIPYLQTGNMALLVPSAQYGLETTRRNSHTRLILYRYTVGWSTIKD